MWRKLSNRFFLGFFLSTMNVTSVSVCKLALDASFQQHDIQHSGRKNVLRKLLRIPYRRLKAGFFCVLVVLTVFVCLSLREFWMKCTRWTFASQKALYFVWLSSLENYFGFGTTNVKGKTDHPVSLRRNKEFWTFAKRRVFFWLFIRFICEQISPSFRRAELKPAFFN